MNLISKILLVLILIIALGLRVYKLDSIPPSISWDEAAVGVNGWTIANYGRDEYGKFFPLYFRSFADDKHPVHIYLTALSVKFLGLSEFNIRLPSALFGVLNVLLIFLLTNLLFRSQVASLFAAFSLAISPQAIHFSRFNHEANFALFFYLLGLVLFYLSMKKKIMLVISTLSFSICFLAYHPAKLVVPLTLMLLSLLYIKSLLLNKKNLFFSIIIVFLLAALVALNPPLLGIARINQNSIGKDSNFWRKINLYLTQYSWHFSPNYLFISGDKNPRLSSQSTGEFYKIDGIFLILGLIYLMLRRSKESLVVLFWAVIAPIPSALAAEAPHAARSMFMMGSWHIISALGLYSILTLVKKPIFKIILLTLVFVILVVSLKNYLNYYYGEYPKRYAIEWQYGMKQIVEFTKDHNEYSSVYMTDARSQPYIFFLYYLRKPLPEYLQSVIYNNNLDNKSYNNVATFDKYSFGGWNPAESLPIEGVLYVLSPSQYDGLRFKSKFDIKKVIYYPNNSVAFIMVSAKL